eukprot:451161-Pyramimonas_sp.AAC.1
MPLDGVRASVTPPLGAGILRRCAATAGASSPWRCGGGWALLECVFHRGSEHIAFRVRTMQHGSRCARSIIQHLAIR